MYFDTFWSTEDLTKNFDSSLRLSSKFSSSRFSPYSRTSPSSANLAASRRSLETANERNANTSERIRRRRHRSEPNPTEEKALESKDRKHDKKQPLAKSSKVAKSLKVTASCSVQSQRTQAPPPDEALHHHEEVNVNELAAYLENSVLIPRKMSSMAETIYGWRCRTWPASSDPPKSSQLKSAISPKVLILTTFIITGCVALSLAQMSNRLKCPTFKKRLTDIAVDLCSFENVWNFLNSSIFWLK